MRPSCMGSFSVGRETVGGRDDATCGVEARLSNWRPQSDETSDPLLMTLPLIIIELYGTVYHLGQVLRSRPRVSGTWSFNPSKIHTIGLAHSSRPLPTKSSNRPRV